MPSTSQSLNNSSQSNTILLASSSQPASPAPNLNSLDDVTPQNSKFEKKKKNTSNETALQESPSNSVSLNPIDQTNFLPSIGCSGSVNSNGLVHSHSTPNLEGRLFNRIDELANYCLPSYYTFYTLPCSSYHSFYGSNESEIAAGTYSPASVFTNLLTPVSYFPFVVPESELNSYQYFMYDTKFVSELRKVEAIIRIFNSNFSNNFESDVTSNQHFSYAQGAKHTSCISTYPSTMNLPRKSRYRRQSTSSLSLSKNRYNAYRQRRTFTESTIIKFDKKKQRFQNEKNNTFPIASNYLQPTNDLCVFNNETSPLIKIRPVLNFYRPSYAQVAATPLNSASSTLSPSSTLNTIKQNLSSDNSAIINDLLSLNLSNNSFQFPSS